MSENTNQDLSGVLETLDEIGPRMAHVRWLRPIDSLFRTLHIYHFQVGKAGGI